MLRLTRANAVGHLYGIANREHLQNTVNQPDGGVVDGYGGGSGSAQRAHHRRIYIVDQGEQKLFQDGRPGQKQQDAQMAGVLQNGILFSGWSGHSSSSHSRPSATLARKATF